MSLCALCKQAKDIRESHLLPRSCYKLLRTRHPRPGRSADPIVITRRSAIISSRQIVCPLLCHDCEDRFNRNGERTVVRECLRSLATFRLRDKLRREKRRSGFRSTIWYSGADLTTVDVEKYRYFTASVFWRASVGRWNVEDLRSWRGALGPKYHEAFRRYLLGEEPYPRQARTCVIVANEEHAMQAASTPSTRKEVGHRVHRFHMLGMDFFLYLGALQAPDAEAVFAGFGSDVVFVLHDSQESPTFNPLHEMLRASKARGALAKHAAGGIPA